MVGLLGENMERLNSEMYAGRTIIFDKPMEGLVYARWKSVSGKIITSTGSTKEGAFE